MSNKYTMKLDVLILKETHAFSKIEIFQTEKNVLL